MLYGSPVYVSGNTLLTYELGGSYLSTENGKPQKYNVVYSDAAELTVNQEVLLFLDNAGNIINERYGIYRKHSEGYYYDYANHVYSLDSIKALLASRNEP